MLSQFFPSKMGITTAFVDINDWAAVEAAIRTNTKVGGGWYAPTLLMHQLVCLLDNNQKAKNQQHAGVVRGDAVKPNLAHGRPSSPCRCGTRTGVRARL